MKETKKILAPTDLSENSKAGLYFALSLAVESDAELLVVHVASEFQAWEPYSDEAALISVNLHPSLAEKAVREATTDLNRFLEPHGDAMHQVGILRKRVVLGPAARKIVEVAEEEQADLIVMSRRRRGVTRRFFLASVTDRVIREAPCPVFSFSPPRQARRWQENLVLSAWLPPLYGEPAAGSVTFSTGRCYNDSKNSLSNESLR